MKQKIIFCLSCLILFSGCFCRTTMMTRESFDQIHLGTPVRDVQCIAGMPYQINCLGGGKEEFEYIERIELGNSIVVENRYFLIIMEGQVVAKRFCQERPPAFDIIYRDDPTLSY
jgi:hypothetical protein